MSPPYLESPDQDNLLNLSKIIILLFLLVGGSLFFWGLVRSNSILSRADNPRLLEKELRIHRGEIVDRNNNSLARSEGTQDRQQRIYPVETIGPLVGYYSVQHGTAGAENGFDEILRSDPPTEWEAFWQNSFNIPQEGRNVKLALDLDLQMSALTAIEQKPGAVLLLELDGNDHNKVLIRALVSNPSYNPNLLDEQFDALGVNENAPLLNRVTQGQYQPGLLLQPFILASAVDQGLIHLDDGILEPDRVVKVNDEKLQCQSPSPDTANWANVLQERCPAPMMDLADRLGTGGLDTIFEAFGLYRDPLLEIDTTTTPDDLTKDPLLAGIGQDNLSITPLQIGLAMSALANHGTLPQPQIGLATQDRERNWQSWTLRQEINQPVSPEAAATILQILSQENGIIEHNPLVLSGPNETINAWYTGILNSPDAIYIAVVVLEGDKDGEEANTVGRTLFTAVRTLEN